MLEERGIRCESESEQKKEGVRWEPFGRERQGEGQATHRANEKLDELALLFVWHLDAVLDQGSNSAQTEELAL